MFPHQICPEILESNVTPVQQIHAQHCFLIPSLQPGNTEYAADDKAATTKNKVKFYQRSTGKAPFDTNAYVTAVGNESGNENG